MSGTYDFEVQIDGYVVENKERIQEALSEFGNFKLVDHNGMLCATAVMIIRMDDEEQSNAIARAIMKANGGRCEVLIRAYFLDDPPYNTYTYNKNLKYV